VRRALALAFPLLLVACGAPAGDTWQVVAVYTDPSLPGDLPPDAAGRAAVTVTGDAFEGFTGCALVSGSFSRGPEELSLIDVSVSPAPDTCTPGARHVHDQITGLLSEGAVFNLRRLSEYEVLLTLRSDAFDPPSVRMMSL